MTKRVLSAVVALWVLLGAAGRTGAAPVRFDFAGSLTVVPGPLAGLFSVGQPFAVSYLFDPGLPPVGGAVTSGSGYADYASANYSATVPGFSVNAPLGNIRVSNDNTIDEYAAYPLAPVATGAAPPGYSYIGTDLVYRDFTSAALSDTTLPASPSALSAIPGRFSLAFLRTADGTAYQMLGSVNSLTATQVPEPGVASAAVGLCGAALLGRRRRFLRRGGRC